MKAAGVEGNGANPLMAKAYMETLDDPAGTRHDLSGGPLTIGRHPQNSVVIQDDMASRFHCVIERSDKGFRVRDLKSRNGTKVNDAVIESKVLKPGDVVRIGKTRFRFVQQAVVDAIADAGRAEQRSQPVKGKSAPQKQPAAKKPASPPPKRSAGKPPAKPVKPAKAPVPEDEPIPVTDWHESENTFSRSIEEASAARPPVTKQPRAAASPAQKPRRDAIGQPRGHDGDAAIPVTEAPAPAPQEVTAPVSLKALLAAGPDNNLRERDIELIGERGEILYAATDEAGTGGEGVTFLRMLLLAALRTRATDIHLEPRNNGYFMRFRIDGTMVDAASFDARRGALVNGVVKVLSGIDTGRQHAIEEGHFASNTRGRRVDYRVSFTPSVHGQKLVLRVLDPVNAPHDLSELKMHDWMRQSIQRVARQDTGMILVAGPTGSGKTTTLYNVLREIDVRTRNVLTIEDPVEYQIEGVTQISLDERKGDSFAALLRSVLRQDPDVILVGEVRDPETARTAMQAAMTGHLVLSTVHARDAIGTIFRLLDLGIEPYLVATGLNLVLAQRLLRVLCPHCKAPRRPTPQETTRMGRAVEGIDQVFTPVGCPMCVNTGYHGRRGVYELLIVSDALRDIILKTPTIEAIRECLKSSLFTTLSQGGYALVAEGATSIQEVERVMGNE
ncbi:MAG: Flp pilus assembly complex ATPase component TadA [Planctomycetes bacterium]|nr:Flp pilus assembly complex ATPase component TadA [Planctomycetota bacterium]